MGHGFQSNAVLILRLTDLDSCLEGGFIYSSKIVAHTITRVNSSITVILEVLHLLEDLLMTGDTHLEVV